jgi:precorrin-4 C11-methyltransferase
MLSDYKPGMVFFVGAGPGAPDLITVRGRNLIREADLILYAGSLVREELLAETSEHAEYLSSAGMSLQEQVERMDEAVQAGKTVVRLHTGDPSIYGAVAEQMEELKQRGIPFRVVPGVSSAFAAAAALGVELTLPELTQTVILTRLSGRTKVPEKEKLSRLAAHHSSLVIFLSAGMIERVVEELLEAGYPSDTMAAVAYRVTWPEEKIIRGTLAEIGEMLRQAEITHHALIVISPALQHSGSSLPAKSHLYGEGQDELERDGQTAIVTLTRNGTETGKILLDGLDHSLLYAPGRFLGDSPENQAFIPTITSIRQTLQDAFLRHQSLVAVMASGIVVREIAPLLQSKHVDPAVVIVDEAGQFAFSLLSGHKGGANQLARRCAEILGGQVVITTASDVQGLPALDLLPRQQGWKLVSGENLTAVSAALVNREKILVYQDAGAEDWLPEPLPGNIQRCDSVSDVLADESLFSVCITYLEIEESLKKAGKKALVMNPACLCLGIGCNRDTPAEEIENAVREVLNRYQLSKQSLAVAASIDLKADEQGLLEFCENWDLELIFYSAGELSAVDNLPNPSQYALENVGAPGVAEPAAALAAGISSWLVEKQIYKNVTVAVALKEGQ